MDKLINFGAGPAALPQPVLEAAAAALLRYKDTGLSILEIPHRGKLFTAIIEEANELVRELLGLGNDYHVMWMQGGGRLQFCMLPMNFLQQEAGYVDSGHWAAAAMEQAQYYGQTKVVASTRESDYRIVPELTNITDQLDYVHLTTNNTIYGTQLGQIPNSQSPIVADMSSELFSRQLDYKQCQLIYAVAQKNIGPAGVTLVIMHESMAQRQARDVPDILSYREMARQNSMVNTPPVFAIYTSLLTLRWIKEQGLDTLERKNEEKARILYQAIDKSNLFYGVAEPDSRSKMNVCFRLHRQEETIPFLDFCRERKITGIKGHRSVGGFRASLYNAISLEEVKILVRAIEDFTTHTTP